MAKGSNFERKIATILSNWWSPGRTDIFWRTAGSGARATVRSGKGLKTTNSYSDIGWLDECGKPLLELLTVEIKIGYGTASLADLLDKGPKMKEQIWERWIRKAQASAKAAGTPYWIIIAKRDRREPIVAMPWEFRNVGLMMLDGPFRGRPIPAFFSVNLDHFDCCLNVVTLNRFLEELTPDHVRKLVQQRKDKTNDQKTAQLPEKG